MWICIAHRREYASNACVTASRTSALISVKLALQLDQLNTARPLIRAITITYTGNKKYSTYTQRLQGGFTQIF